MSICIFPNCETEAITEYWCLKHWSLFPHLCETNGCTSQIMYDDEPFCSVHAPHNGFSIKGYSASKRYIEARKAHPSSRGHDE